MLATFGVSKKGKAEFGNIAGGLGPVGNDLLDFARDNPVAAEAITTAISVVFPPARAIKTAIDVANAVRPTMEEGQGGDLDQVNKGWKEGEGSDVESKAQHAKQGVKAGNRPSPAIKAHATP